jgi:hypothetical protein
MNLSALLSIAIAVVGTATLGFLTSGASLLPALLFWTAFGQGVIALVAAAELTRARWILPLRPVLLGLQPLLLIFPVAFLVFARDLTVYPWTAHPTGWLRPDFFIGRNLALLLLSWLLAGGLARAIGRAAPRRGSWAVAYLLAFALNQTVIAFDWVMSFEYPWISTLFGAYFFVEAFYAGIAAAAVTAALLLERSGAMPRSALRDAATLLFGFSLLWAGQFFAQYLVIWYGNLPQEVSFLARRILDSPLRELSTLVLGCLFLIPFLILLSRRAKSSPLITTMLAGVVLLGILLERLVFLLPVVELQPAAAAGAFLLIGIAYLLRGRDVLRGAAR